MNAYLTREQIQERIKVPTRNPKYLTRDQIRQRIQELPITNPPMRPNKVVWDVS